MHVFPSAGTYSVTVTVTDADGWSCAASQPAVVAAPSPGSTAGDYTLDDFTSATWAGWNTARAAHPWPDSTSAQSGFVLDGWGGLHAFQASGDAMPAAISVGAYWPGWDIARGVTFVKGSTTAGYTLDGWGGLHPFGGTATVSGPGYFPGRDVVRSVWTG